MTLWDVVNFGVSFGGLCLSGIAAYQANSARDAVRKVLEKNNGQEDRDRIAALITESSKARTLVSQWMPGVATKGQGRRRQDDLVDLYATLDKFRTASPIKPIPSLQEAIGKCTDQLDSAIKKIAAEPPDDTGWTEARNALQALHPNLEAAEREMKLKQLQ